MKDLSNRVNNRASTSSSASEPFTEQEEQALSTILPCTTYENLEQLNGLLNDGSDLKTIVFKKYKKNTNVPGRTRGLNIIDDFISGKLFTNLSWTGIRHSPDRPAKLQFSHFKNIIKCLWEVCFESDNDFKLDAMAKFLQSMMHNLCPVLRLDKKVDREKYAAETVVKEGKKRKTIASKLMKVQLMKILKVKMKIKKRE